LIAVGIITAINVAVIGVPVTVALASGQPEKIEFYIKALHYGLQGLKSYFDFIVELFKAAAGV